jgi:two-component system phosphate regulon sensor histidine kinase PhoR
MKKSIFIKVFCAFFSIVVILSALILIFSFKTIRSHYIDTLTLDLKNLGITLILKVKPLLKEGRFEELDALAKKLGKDISTRITIIDPEGVVLADSEENPKLMENHKIRPEVLQVLNGDVGTSLRSTHRTGRKYFRSFKSEPVFERYQQLALHIKNKYYMCCFYYHINITSWCCHFHP